MTVPIRPEPPGFIEALMQAMSAQRDATAVAPPSTPQAQLAKNGITNEQRSAYKGRLSDALYSHVQPFAYEGHTGQIASALLDAVLGTSPINTAADHTKNPIPGLPDGVKYPERDDAWRTFLGIPQQSNTFAVSDTRPSVSTDPNATYYKLTKFAHDAGLDDPQTLRSYVDFTKDHGGKAAQTDTKSNVMGEYTLGTGAEQGRPYLSYYDKWDLKPDIANRVGKPFEIYDRIYYDPQTYRMLPRQRQSAFVNALMAPLQGK